jgi:hypothetical protein
MDEIYIYRIKLPGKSKEAVLPCKDGYTIYIDERLDDAQALREYQHAIYHIENGDLESEGTVQEIEKKAHRR